MFLIVGLGNPGLKYACTRHNAGFEAIDKIADQIGAGPWESRHKGLCAKGVIGGEKVLLLKPLTYMNLSGESAGEAVRFYKLDPERDVLVVFDDISLPPGQIRIRKKGSAGGHNGIKSLISHFGTQNFMRIKVGVGEKPAGWDLADFVLSRPEREVLEDFREGLDEAAEAAVLIAKGGVDEAMNTYNRKKVKGDA